MTIYFLDSSALVKRYIKETGSTWILGLFVPNNEVFVAAITSVEIVAAVTRRLRGISSTDTTRVCNQVRNDFQTDYQIVEVTEDIISRAMTLAENSRLRGYDAIQLATGVAINTLCTMNGLPPLIFVSADEELNQAASKEGLDIENPNNPHRTT